MIKHTKNVSQQAARLPQIASIVEIPVGKIFPNPDQPRKRFPADALTALAKSIAQDGIVQPLTVRESGEGYVLVSGERRLRAAKLAGCGSVPCVIVRITDKRSAVVALIENIQRAELDCFEEAEAINALMQNYSMTRDEVSLRLGLAQSTVSNKLRLLRLTPQQRRLICENGLTERHARALLRLSDGLQINRALEHILSERMTVARTEKYIDDLLAEENKRRSYKKRAAVLGDVRLFQNTVDKAVKVMKLAGVQATFSRTEHDGVIEFVITVPGAADAGAVDEGA
ncbi:MAG: ParB/RepB/Spo0J family partition protein [Ruminococcus sp.]|nr:ParB/RepB/Spo0J family partition protein [Ruminococcus sp.]